MAQEVSIYERNQFGIAYKRCCASCALKKYRYDGKRYCKLNNEMVESLDVCDHWQMMEGLQNAGRKSGVVKDMVTKEVIF